MSDLKERLAKAAADGATTDAALAPVFGVNSPATHNPHEVKRLPLSQLVPWSNAEYTVQPFRPYSPQEMVDMMASLSEYGLHMPIIVRPMDGKYQILAGHNRTQAARNLGWTEIDALVKPADLSDAEAAAILVDTNFNQRPRILPSERAWGWKIKMDNMRHQGTSSHDGTKLRSDTQLGKDAGKGRSTIQRYISLTNLIRPLLDIVDGYQYDDAGEWSLNPAKPLIPITAAEKLVDLSENDQDYIVALFTTRRIVGISKGQAVELKASVVPGGDIPVMVLRRCLGLDDTGPEKTERPYVLKFSPALFSSSSAQKYMADIELQEQIVGVIERYVAEKECSIK